MNCYPFLPTLFPGFRPSQQQGCELKTNELLSVFTYATFFSTLPHPAPAPARAAPSFVGLGGRRGTGALPLVENFYLN
jgi:hypothetical protein